MFTVTFPLIAPAIISGMLLSFIVMLGIYGIPAVLGTPGDIPVLTTYIFKLTNWSPPLYSTAASVAIILMVVTGFLVWLQHRVTSRRSYTTVAGKAFRPALLNLGPWRYLTLGLAVVYLFVVVVLPTMALIVAAFRKFLSIRTVASLFDDRQYSLIHFERLWANPLALRSIYQYDGGRAHHGDRRRRVRLRASAIRSIAPTRRAAAPSTSSRRCPSPFPASSSALPTCGPGSACPAGCTARSGSWRWPSSPASCPIR